MTRPGRHADLDVLARGWRLYGAERESVKRLASGSNRKPHDVKGSIIGEAITVLAERGETLTQTAIYAEARRWLAVIVEPQDILGAYRTDDVNLSDKDLAEARAETKLILRAARGGADLPRWLRQLRLDQEPPDSIRALKRSTWERRESAFETSGESGVDLPNPTQPNPLPSPDDETLWSGTCAVRTRDEPEAWDRNQIYDRLHRLLPAGATDGDRDLIDWIFERHLDELDGLPPTDLDDRERTRLKVAKWRLRIKLDKPDDLESLDRAFLRALNPTEP